MYIDVYIDVYILCVYPSNTLNHYIYSSNVLLSFFFFHFPITRNDEVLKGLMHTLLFIYFIYFTYFVFHADLIPLCSTPARGMPDGQPFNLSANFKLVLLDHVYLRHLSAECRSILSADMATDTRPICRSSVGRHVVLVNRPSVDTIGRYVGRHSADTSADMLRSTVASVSVDCR